MSKVLGTNQGFIVNHFEDSDGELTIMIIDNDGSESETWLNKGHAIELINHLTRVFDITPEELDK